MESGCLRYNDIPHTSKLFLDFQYRFDRVSAFYSHCPMDPACYAAAAREVNFPPERRAALVAALRTANGESAALELLAKEKTVAVVTGQQVGLFSGPAYTIYKALTAARLAEKLTSGGIPAVPIFWLATEDHDFAEVNHAFVFDSAHQPVTLQVEGSGESQQPVGTIAVEGPPIDTLRETLEGLPFAEETIAAVADAYRPGTSFGNAFHHLLRRILGKWGLLFLDPLDPAIRKIAAPLLASAFDKSSELKDRLLERNRALANAGYHAQVLVEPQTSLFFLLDGTRRIPLRKDNGRPAHELVEHAEQLSPNALLRPVMQDYILPTVAYVGGPAELAYLAQSQVLYQALLGRMPVVLARSSFTLLDQRSAKLMDRHHIALPDLFQSSDQVREAIARRLVPKTLTDHIARVQQSTVQALNQLRAELTGFDPTLASALDKSRSKVAYQLSKMERKIARETLRRDQRATRDADSLSGLVYPRKHLQERYYSILPFLAGHGEGLLDTLYSNVHLDCPDHKILVV